MLRRLIIAMCTLAVLLTISAVAEEPPSESKTDTTAAEVQKQYFAYYFHGDVRCATCKKLEAYSGEALTTGFADELDDSLLVWKPINFDREENKHFIDDYKLYTKALILSCVENGKETAYKNLDQIWLKVSDKDDFIDYVQSETKKFLDGESEQESE